MLKNFFDRFKTTKGGAATITFAPEGDAIVFKVPGFPGPPSDWVFSPPEGLPEADAQRLRVLSQWLMEGTAYLTDDGVAVDATSWYQADSSDLDALDLAPPCGFRFSLSALGSLHEPDFAISTRIIGSDGLPKVGFKRHACLFENGVSRLLLSRPQFELLRQLEAFERRPNHDRTYEAQLLAFSRLKAVAQELAAELDPYMLKETAVVPKAVGIELIDHSNGELEVRPVVEGASQDALSRSLDAHRQVPTVLTLQQPDGARQRLVFEPEVRDALNQVKTVRRLRGKARREFLARPQEFLDATLVNLDDFGERVKGIGQFEIRYYPLIERGQRGWIPETIALSIVSEDPRVESVTIEFDSIDDFQPLAEAHEEALRDGEPAIEWQGHVLPIDGDTRPTLEAIREALEIRDRVSAEDDGHASPEAPEAPPEPEQEDVRDFLLIHSNLDSEDYEEPAPQQGAEFALSRPKALLEHIKLLPHQVEGIAWLQTRFKQGSRGVLLADDMGLGKTLQILAFLAWYAQEVASPKPILVVAPVALLEVWRDEYAKFLAPIFDRPLELHGAQLSSFKRVHGAGREYQHEGGRKILDVEAIANHKLVLTTFETVRDYQFSLASLEWGVVVTDESQKIKTPGALVTNAVKALNSDFRIVATGTPVENSLVDLWSLIDFAQPGLLGSLRTFRQRYDQPKSRRSDGGESSGQALREHIEPAFLRRLKVDILKELPPRLEYTTPLPMSALQAQRYLELTQAYRVGNKGQGAMLKVLRQLRDLCTHPGLLEDGEPRFDASNLASTSPKLQWTLDKLRELERLGEKVVLFTEDRKLQRCLAQMIQATFGFVPAIVNGTVPGSSSTGVSRKMLIDRFQEKPGFNAIVLSPVAVGFGLTITAANHVIHVTRLWNPAKEDQATDRVHRIGQTKDVHIYYPVAVDPHQRFASFDQILADLLSQKRELARNVLFPTDDLAVDAEALAKMLGTAE